MLNRTLVNLAIIVPSVFAVFLVVSSMMGYPDFQNQGEAMEAYRGLLLIQMFTLIGTGMLVSRVWPAKSAAKNVGRKPEPEGL